MDESVDFDTAYERAVRRGVAPRGPEPQAVAARYDAVTGLVHVDLANGAGFHFPARLAEGLDDASDGDLSDIEVSPRGYGLHWPALDVDLSVPGLLAGLFGTRAWMDRQRAAKAGAARSEKKAAAARSNGMKGGRPKKLL